MSREFLSDEIKQNIDKYIVFNNDVVDIIYQFPDRTLVYNHDLNEINRFMGFGIDVLYDDAIDVLLTNYDKKVGEYGIEFINQYIEYFLFKNWIYFSDTPKKNEGEIKVLGSKEYYYPPHLAIELTDSCNLACKHCYRDAKQTGNFIEKKSLFEFIDILHEKGLMIIELTGGEVTLHPDFCEIVDYLTERLDIVAILTNGYKYDQEIIDCIIRNKDNLLVNISLDSYNRRFHDSFRGREGSWQRAYDLIKILALNGVLTRVAMSVTPENLFDIPATIKLAKDLGARSFAWDQVSNFGRGGNIDWSNVTEEEFYQYEKQNKYLLKKYFDMLTIIPAKVNRQMTLEGLNCGAGWRTFAIDPTGELRLCVNAAIDLLKIGNVFEEGIEVFKKDVLKELANLSLPNYRECKNCQLFAYCNNCTLRGFVGARHTETCNWNGRQLAKKVNVTTTINHSCYIKRTIAN